MLCLLKSIFFLYFSCKLQITKAKGLLQDSHPLYSAKLCQDACKKNKECVQWEWQDNIRTTYRLVSKNFLTITTSGREILGDLARGVKYLPFIRLGASPCVPGMRMSRL